MQTTRIGRSVLLISISLVETLGAFFLLILIPSDSKGAFLFGFSIFRLLLLMFFIFLIILFTWLLYILILHPNRAEGFIQKFLSDKKLVKFITIFLITSTLSSLLLLITPFDQFVGYSLINKSIYERIFPLVILIFLFSIQSLLFLGSWGQAVPHLRKNQGYFILIGVFLFVLFLFELFMSFTGLNEQRRVNFLHEPGVPFISAQILFLLIFVFIFLFIIDAVGSNHPVKKFLNKHIDIYISLGIFIITAVLWVSTPTLANFYQPGPFPPGNSLYPHIDAAWWDKSAQFALIGQGFANGFVGYDHIGYSAILAFFHFLVGQDYSKIIFLQGILYASFPVVLYLLGKSMHSRAFGVFFAGLGIIYEINAIAAENWINTTTIKFLMSEFPTGIGLAFLSLFLFLWLKRNPEKRKGYVFPVGGILSILILLRFNTLFLPFVIFVILLFVFGKDWKGWIKSTVLVLAALILVLSPWIWRSWQYSGTPLFFYEKSIGVIDPNFREIPPPVPTDIPNQARTPEPTIQPTETVPSEQISPLIQTPIKVPSLEANAIESQAINNQPAPIAAVKQWNISAIRKLQDASSGLIITHFYNNLVSSTLILPTTLYPYNLKQIIYEAHPYWGKITGGWSTKMSLVEGLLFWVNLGIITIGIVFAYKRWKFSGFIPLMIFLGYNFATALARTSGGRYIVPAQWVVYLYFGLGLFEIIHAFFALFQKYQIFNEDSKSFESFSYKKGLFFTLPFIVFIGALTIFDRVIPQKYPTLSKDEVLDYATQQKVLQKTSQSFLDLKEFLKSPNATALYGQALYPRFLKSGEGLIPDQEVFFPKDFPRLAFFFIGPFGDKQVLLPLQDSPKEFINASSVIVFGCEEARKGEQQAYIDAIMVIILGEEPRIYSRDPLGGLKCPLRSPE